MKPITFFTYVFLLFVGITANAQYATTLTFTGTANGKTPFANVIISGSTMYGMTSAGGANNVGCIFSIGTNGSGYTDLHDFQLMTGDAPHGSLILSGSTLYGVTNSGGTGSDGVVFSIATNGTGYSVLHNFNGTAGSHPMGSLILSGSTLYGTASSGGAHSDGCLFSISTSGTGYSDFYDFTGTTGSSPEGSLLLSGSTLYATTLTGGANSDGVIFSVTTTGGSYTDMHDCSSSTGKGSHGSLILSGSTLYGLETAGGANSDGCVFSITTGGTYTDLYDFTGTYGSTPVGDVLLSNGVLLGLASAGGANSDGVIFSVHTDGTQFTDLHDFNGTNGSTPYGSVMLSSGVLYGMTTAGGSSSDGVIFNYTICDASVSASVMSNDICNGGSTGSISASASGASSPPFSYSWTGGQTNSTATGLTAGTYTVTATDYYGCSVTASATITQPTALSVTASAKTAAICPGASDSLFSTPSGGTSPYTYSWTPYEFSAMSCNTCSKTLCYPFGTTYTITVTDNNGCAATASVSITIRPFPYVNVSGPINPIAPSRSDTLVATAVGATYLWSNASTNSSIIVSPSVSTTYTVKATNTYGCYDSASYTIDTDQTGTGANSSSPIRIVPSTTLNTASFSTYDSVAWFSFVAADSNDQIICNSAYLGVPVPHAHRLTLYNSSLAMIVDEHMPDIQGANQIRIDISHLTIGDTYYVRAARTPAHANMPGCNPTGDVCNASQRWSFKMGIRTIHVFVPNDSGSEAPSISQLYYESRGQIRDLNNIPRFDIKAYTNSAKPAVYCSDSAVSFVYAHVDTSRTFIDTIQRVDMVIVPGPTAQPYQPVFKTEEDSGAGYLNYFLGFVPNGVPKVEGYSRLVYKNIYSNTDMEVYSNNVGTKLYFICNPASGGVSAGNPANIELKFKGATSVSVTGGGLQVATELGTLNFAPGFAYTDSAGIIKAKSWKANFVAVNSNTVEFNTGTYNTSEPLVIEVDRGKSASTITSCVDNLCWSTYYGGTEGQAFIGVTTDNANNVYTTGFTSSSDFPVSSGAIQVSLTGQDNVTVAAFAATTHSRLWATYYGGSDIDEGNSIAVDASQNVYIAGYTNSPDLPQYVAGSSYNQPAGINGTGNGGAYDALIFKLNNSGSPVWAFFYGGVASEQANHIVLDGANNVYVVGGYQYPTVTPTVPTYSVTGAYNSTTGTGWIAKFSTAGVWEWGTTIGGSNSGGSSTSLIGCAVDNGNNLYVIGQASETGYPIVSPGANATYIGGPDGLDAVVTKFNTTNAIAWSTYYGGDGDDAGYSITTDNSDNAYITGYTDSPISTTSLLLATGPYNQSYGATRGSSTYNGFIAEFAPNGTMPWSTYFGGNNQIQGTGITFDNNDGQLFLTGYNPAPGNAMPVPGSNPVGTYSVVSPPGSNAFIAAFNSWEYLWGTYFGGSRADQGLAITTDGADNLYIVGKTDSPNTIPSFPLVYNPYPAAYYQGTYNASTTSSFISQFTLASVTGINTLTTTENEIKVYPNPTSQDITVEMELKEQGNVDFTLYNLLGEVVYSYEVKEESGSINQQISLSLLSEGTYILKVTVGNTVYHQKIVKLQ